MSCQIHVKVSPMGDVLVVAHGFKSSCCEAATHAIEDALGTKVTRRRKSDYWSQYVIGRNQQALGGSES